MKTKHVNGTYSVLKNCRLLKVISVTKCHLIIAKSDLKAFDFQFLLSDRFQHYTSEA